MINVIGSYYKLEFNNIFFDKWNSNDNYLATLNLLLHHQANK